MGVRSPIQQIARTSIRQPDAEVFDRVGKIYLQLCATSFQIRALLWKTKITKKSLQPHPRARHICLQCAPPPRVLAALAGPGV